jgi:hypothetical protein
VRGRFATSYLGAQLQRLLVGHPTGGGVLERVRHFDEFTTDNDPHGEHDFGNFELAGVNYFFKIDYYATDMQGGSGDPADPEKTTRVLTIMRADEY